MRLLENLRTIEYVDYLIRSGGTGKTDQLGKKLSLSERQTYRLIMELRDIGFPIAWNPARNSYTYDQAVKFEVRLVIGDTSMLRIN